MVRRKLNQPNVLLFLVIFGAFPVLTLVYLALYTDGRFNLLVEIKTACM